MPAAATPTRRRDGPLLPVPGWPASPRARGVAPESRARKAPASTPSLPRLAAARPRDRPAAPPTHRHHASVACRDRQPRWFARPWHGAVFRSGIEYPAMQIHPSRGLSDRSGRSKKLRGASGATTCLLPTLTFSRMRRSLRSQARGQCRHSVPWCPGPGRSVGRGAARQRLRQVMLTIDSRAPPARQPGKSAGRDHQRGGDGQEADRERVRTRTAQVGKRNGSRRRRLQPESQRKTRASTWRTDPRAAKRALGRRGTIEAETRHGREHERGKKRPVPGAGPFNPVRHRRCRRTRSKSGNEEELRRMAFPERRPAPEVR